MTWVEWTRKAFLRGACILLLLPGASCSKPERNRVGAVEDGSAQEAGTNGAEDARSGSAGAENASSGGVTGLGGSASAPTGEEAGGKGATSGETSVRGGRAGGIPLEITGLPRRIEKLDLLFTIDNSRSMADKQAILRDAIPSLVRRITAPRCRDGEGKLTDTEIDPSGLCPAGLSPEFYPIKDIHIAVITTSLGAHGGQECVPTAVDTDPSVDDAGYPIGLLNRPGLLSQGWDQSGFLAWDPDARRDPPGLADRTALEGEFTDMLLAVGETGCGYESTLESWYRFLIDPEPPLEVLRSEEGVNPVTLIEGTDTALLDVRARFLRPDSFVVVTMLSDENDCSITDERLSWIIGTTANGFRMPRARAVCETDPNDPCCASCAVRTPENCEPDPVCEDFYLDALDDNINLRCHDQKRRFGIDFLHPLSRYVDGLTKPNVLDRAGEPRPNPLYEGGERDPSMVFLVGIVGVPWQDVASEKSFAEGAPLEILSYDALEAEGRFEWMLPADENAFPLDGLMHETPLDRTQIEGLSQTHPGTGVRLAPSGNATPRDANPINGKESLLPQQNDLQFACTFPLAKPVECEDSQQSCDCFAEDKRLSLCDGKMQTHAKAYPGTRQIQVLRDVGKVNGNTVVASICPKVSDPALKHDPSYGYTPILHALFTRLRRARN